MKAAATKRKAPAKRAPTTRAATTGHFMLQRNDRYEVEQVRDAVAQLKKNPEQGRAMLVQAGIYTHAGKLTKAFGG